MSEEIKSTSEMPRVSKNEPTLWDLIDQYFPAKYKEIYSDPMNVYKTAKAAAIEKLKLGRGHRLEDYVDRMDVHQIASKLHKEHPEMRASEMAEHPEMKRIIGRRLKPETIISHIRDLKFHGQGRPKGSKNTIPQ